MRHQWTERAMLDLLHERYKSDELVRPRYVCAEHVRSQAGDEAPRAADFIAVDGWPSKGLAVSGHEVKVSRADWRRELADPGKAAEIAQHCDYWWLVAPAGVAFVDELPERWGLLVPVVKSHRAWMRETIELRVARRPARLRRPKKEPAPMERSFAVAFLRAVARTERRRAETRLQPAAESAQAAPVDEGLAAMDQAVSQP